ncbi:hypothetical protein L21SP2_1504 [Salinispira pacifica]|uniref:Uncharacterized protein n=1 Tax=Salinispira pacifica TaxID=1307761 RepID=V5WI99_9SPIO|nr:hypothetical protein L21SP2_1504 [Salinispira pacifica]
MVSCGRAHISGNFSHFSLAQFLPEDVIIYSGGYVKNE